MKAGRGNRLPVLKQVGGGGVGRKEKKKKPEETLG